MIRSLLSSVDFRRRVGVSANRFVQYIRSAVHVSWVVGGCYRSHYHNFQSGIGEYELFRRALEEVLLLSCEHRPSSILPSLDTLSFREMDASLIQLDSSVLCASFFTRLSWSPRLWYSSDNAGVLLSFFYFSLSAFNYFMMASYAVCPSVATLVPNRLFGSKVNN